MTQHYRHYRVANRHRSCMTSPMEKWMDKLQEQPLLLFSLIFFLVLFMIKCITCNR